VRRLIVNADDFGLTSGVNRAIVEAHERGIVTSATMMANGTAVTEAVNTARNAPGLGVGCHVVLVDGVPLSDPSQIGSLLDGNGSQRFRASLSDFAIQCFRRKLVPAEIQDEAARQIRKLQAEGISVSHLDTHKHTHLFPQVLQPLLRAANACGVHAIRNPVELIPFGRVAENPGLWKRWAQVRVLNRVARRFRSMVQDAGLRTPDGSIGIVATGLMDETILRFLIEHIPEGTWELVCHPGYDDPDLARAGTRLRAARVRELELLKSAEIRRELEAREIKLVSYRDLD
jgi:hopanoid biosynthesis associated protein HpnK